MNGLVSERKENTNGKGINDGNQRHFQKSSSGFGRVQKLQHS